jgi:hypothetical protein
MLAKRGSRLFFRTLERFYPRVDKGEIPKKVLTSRRVLSLTFRVFSQRVGVPMSSNPLLPDLHSESEVAARLDVSIRCVREREKSARASAESSGLIPKKSSG